MKNKHVKSVKEALELNWTEETLSAAIQKIDDRIAREYEKALKSLARNKAALEYMEGQKYSYAENRRCTLYNQLLHIQHKQFNKASDYISRFKQEAHRMCHWVKDTSTKKHGRTFQMPLFRYPVKGTHRLEWDLHTIFERLQIKYEFVELHRGVMVRPLDGASTQKIEAFIELKDKCFSFKK